MWVYVFQLLVTFAPGPDACVRARPSGALGPAGRRPAARSGGDRLPDRRPRRSRRRRCRPPGYVAVLTCLAAVGLWNAVRLLRLRRPHRRPPAPDRARHGPPHHRPGVCGRPGHRPPCSLVSAVANVDRQRPAPDDRRRPGATWRSPTRCPRCVCCATGSRPSDHDLHTGQARLHEIRATLAGIATADRAAAAAEISPDRRRAAARMTVAELRRLDRLVSESGRPRADADRARRHAPADHRPTRGRRPARLLAAQRPRRAWRGPTTSRRSSTSSSSNAQRHAAGRAGPTSRSHRGRPRRDRPSPTADRAIDPEVRSRLFSWGAHGARSPGAGRRPRRRAHAGRRPRRAPRARRLRRGRGARFVLSLPVTAATRRPGPVGR